MGLEPEQLREALALWDQQAPRPETLDAYEEAHAVIVAAARELLTKITEAALGPADYDVALPEIEEWVNRKGA